MTTTREPTETETEKERKVKEGGVSTAVLLPSFTAGVRQEIADMNQEVS